MAKMNKIYGPVVGLFFGPSQPLIAVCGHEAAKEALLNEDLNGRPTTAVLQARTYDKKLGNNQYNSYFLNNIQLNEDTISYRHNVY